MAGHLERLVVVDAALDHRIDFNRREPGLFRRTDAVQHAFEAV